MASKRLPPKWTSKAAPDPSPVEGVDNLPLPMGVNRWAVQQAERDSEATPAGMDAKANGDNPAVADKIDFAPTQGMPAEGGPKGSDPFPAMPGAR